MEWVLYIEVPKHLTHYTQGTQARDYKSQVTWVQTCLGTVGNSKYIAYFGGGLKYYNENGNLQDSDVVVLLLVWEMPLLLNMVLGNPLLV